MSGNYYLGSFQIDDQLHSNGFTVYFQIWSLSHIQNSGRATFEAIHINGAYSIMSQRIVCDSFCETSHLVKPFWELLLKSRSMYTNE